MCHFGSNNANTLDGMTFLRYIAPQDQQRFTDFLTESSQTNAPARSLHVDMKDSSGVTFSAELFHVTVPSLTASEIEHLIGISNSESSGDRVERFEQMGKDVKDTLAHNHSSTVSATGNDMRHILGHRFQHPAFPSVGRRSKDAESKSSRSSRSSSHSSKSSRQADLKKLESLEKINIIIDVGSEDFLIRSVRLTFNIPENCGTKDSLPNLIEWLKPSSRQYIVDWIQSHANAYSGGHHCKEQSLRGMKLSSPFPSTTTLLAGELKFSGATDGFVEHDNGTSTTGRVISESISSSGVGDMHMNIELRQLFVH